ncbi:Inositol phosphorylceramide glucuronosyltransferase 1 [Capsicum annuum]|nr:Inositol phosphorylceramide glucuronosyltransferase 1 [Capsicum annuum]
MRMSVLRFGVLIFLLLCNCFIGAYCSKSEEAYVTLLYGDEFLLGVRVLGKSIRDTGSNKDMVVLVSDGVSQYAKKLLQADGWIVEKISLLANPNQVRPKRFWGVYTKLKVFNMTSYKKVVYLDADTIVVKSIEDLFKCGKFCANLKHSERLNSGVMVVEPSEKVFNDMMSKVTTLPSYTGGDQGFLNSYYVGFANAHVYKPNLPSDILNSRKVPEMERLSTLYNADVGLYMLANKTIPPYTCYLPPTSTGCADMLWSMGFVVFYKTFLEAAIFWMLKSNFCQAIQRRAWGYPARRYVLGLSFL